MESHTESVRLWFCSLFLGYEVSKWLEYNRSRIISQILLFFVFKKKTKTETTTEEITGLSHDQIALFNTFRGTTQVCAR